MPEPMILILRRRRMSESDLEARAIEFSKNFALDPYIVRVNLAGDGLAMLAKGEPDRLRKIGRVLSDHGFAWCLTPPKPAPARPLEVKRFSVAGDRVVFEGHFGSREIRRGGRIVTVLAGLQGDIIRKLMVKSAYRSGAPTALTETEKLETILSSGPVLDFYTLPESADDPHWSDAPPLRFLGGKFDPASLGDRASPGVKQNLQAVIDLMRRFAGVFTLEMDFGLCQMPDCRYDTSKDPDSVQRNLEGVGVYGWYLLQFHRQNPQGQPRTAITSPAPSGDAAVAVAFAASAIAGAPAGTRSDPSDMQETPGAGPELLPPPPEPRRNAIWDWLSARELISAALFLAYMFGSPILMSLKSPAGRALKFYGFDKGIFFFVLCAVFVYGSFYCLRLKRWMDNTPTSKARSAAMGLVEMKGVARRAYNLLAPITLTPCVFFRLRKYEKGRNRKNPEVFVLVGTNASGHVPFYLHDETGRVLVNPTGASIRPANKRTIYGSVSLPWISAPLTLGEDVKYEEEIIPEGASVYVLGFARPRRDERAPLRERVAWKLRLLKADRSKLSKYDADKDGTVDQNEWEAARADMENEALREELAENGSPRGSSEQAVVGKPPHGALPFVISESGEEKLTRRYVVAAGFLFACAVASAAAGALLLLS